MNRFVEWLKNNKYYALLTLLLMFLLVPMTVTLGKYVKDQPVGAFSLEVLAEPAILSQGFSFRAAITESVNPKQIIFGYTKDYEAEIQGLRGKSISTKSKWAMFYVRDDTVYVLSKRRIFANPICRIMFSGMTALQSIAGNNFDTSKITTMNQMFRGCSSLTKLAVSNFNTSNVTDMYSMFRGCSSLTSLDVSGWDTSKVTNMDDMFRECTYITELDLSGWTTSSLTTMYNMFMDCECLTSLDLSGWDTSNVTEMYCMFYRCEALTTIYADSGFNTGKAASSGKMFFSCKNLVGGNGTKYNYSYIDKTYARIDGGPNSDTPGYFTEKSSDTTAQFVEDTPSSNLVLDEPIKPNGTEENTLSAEPNELAESSKDSNEDSEPTESGEVSEPEDSDEESQPIEPDEIPESEEIPSQ